MIPIDDPDDPRIEPYRNVRDRDLRGRADAFVAEGEVVLRVLLSPRSQFQPDSVLLSEVRAVALGRVVEAAAPGVPVYVAPARIMDAIVGFPIHRGVLALARRGEPAVLGDLLSTPTGPALALGLIGISNHDNVGGAFRNAAAFGASAVLLDGASCDPLYRKGIRVSVGAALTVPFWRGGSAGHLTDALGDAGFGLFALSPSGALDIACVDWPARTALLVGAEGPGLPRAVLDRIPTVTIPMAAGHDSLNVATATGVALHTIRTARTRAKGD